MALIGSGNYRKNLLGTTQIRDIYSFESVPRGSLSNREVHSRMLAGGIKRPFVKLQGIHNNEVLIICPKKYTVPYGTMHLHCSHDDFPDHAVSINYMVEDGYSCVVYVEDCPGTVVNVRPGFDNEETQVIFTNPLLNKQAAKSVLELFKENE